MASPNAFLLSPSRSSNQKSHFFRSSSPDLPAIGVILSPNYKVRPLKHDNQALVISSDEETEIKKAGNREHKEHKEPLPVGPTPSASNRPVSVEADDSSLFIIEPPTTYTSEARRYHATPPKFRAQSSSPAKDQPWKKFKSKADSSKNGIDEGMPIEIEHVEPPSAQQPTVDPSPPAVGTKSTRAEKDINEPLRLEPATIRRLDWTPPSKKTTAIRPLGSPVLEDLHSPEEAHEAAKSFEQILEAYKCMDSLHQDVAMPSEEDTSILRKRKLVELVTTSAAPTEPSSEAKPKATVKQKAPKKKPRTITEIATSAYRAPDLSESAPLVLDDTTMSTTKEPDAPTTKGESKAKPRKRTSKATTKKKKKPSPPPRPILLPPTEALREVARQDFVFGTSSQLAIENSPTFLRELHAAMRRSNQPEYIDLDTPLNSDGIEPPERKRLWAAAARDVDGDLFNLEMSRIIERSSQPLPALSDDDPFGYTGVDRKTTVSTVSVNGIDTRLQRDSEPPVILRPNGIEPIELVNEDSILLGSDISTGSPLQRRVKLAGVSQLEEPHGPSSNSDPNQAEHHASKPSFELFTDAQLSKEIASYGFKAVKSRQAKISLLEQCWQGKNQLEHPGSKRMFTTSTATEGNASNSEVKTPRGRPRKNSASSPEAQEPPPSAQAPISPSRPRGRPKKAASTAKRTTASASKGKKVSTKSAAEASTARKRKPSTAKVVVEIPDSASESDRRLSPNPISSPVSAFSPPPAVDLSLSLVDDTDPSLALNSTQDRSLSYEYITKAVKSAPRTTDPANPSWHEKILLYDPIVLEDLTTWLNCGQLTRVGFDGEVNTMEVKQWCESKSICCLWKVNLRGKERKRY